MQMPTMQMPIMQMPMPAPVAHTYMENQVFLVALFLGLFLVAVISLTLYTLYSCSLV